MTTARDEPSSLLPQHAALIRGSAIPDAVAAARGYRSLTVAAQARRLGFSAAQARAPALLIPIHGVTGEVVLYQLRPDEPRILEGRSVKYETPPRSRMVIDVPPSARSRLGDPRVPLFITEGVRKGDAAAAIGLCCVALIGVWNWRGTNADGGLTALADWESITLKDRDAFIVFDSDVMIKPAVHAALVRLRAFLDSRHARVRLVYLPSAEGGAKVGLDDFLAAGHGRDDLLALATTELRPPPPEDRQRSAIAYRGTPAGLVWDRPVGDGTVPVALTNFRATIVSQIVEDDGADVRRLYEIEASMGERVRRFRLPVQAFLGMNWPAEQLGANAVTFAGMGLREHTKVAIQLLSGDVPERTVHTHTGWREVHGTWVYLHGGGTIGPVGPVPGMEVRLDDALAGFLLPEPPTGDSLRDAIRASLRILDVGPDRVTVPLLAAVYRAVLGDVDLGIFLTGHTGVFKSELAALAQRHFGTTMDAHHLPGSWESTDNALEGLAFLAKDVLLVIDDFIPRGSPVDIQRLHARADRLFRGQGNRSGRGRMRADTSLRPARPPRGLLAGTGEDVPRGQSLRARMLVLDLAPGDIDATRLGGCQRDAREGLYAAAMAGFIAWLAPRYQGLRDALPARVAALRDRSHASVSHRRTPGIVADLTIALEEMLAFAIAVGAIDAAAAAALKQRCWAALGEAAGAQGEHQSAGDAVERFRQLLASTLVSGRAHVADADGGAPDHPGAWGWRAVTEGGAGFERETWRPGRDRIGWLDGDDLYLDPDAAFAAAQAIGRDTGDGITVLPATLHRRLSERRLLRSVEDGRQRLTIRRTLEGERRTVLHLRASFLEGPSQPSQPSQEDHEGPTRPEDATDAGTTPPVAPDPIHETMVGADALTGAGTVGTDGPVRDAEDRPGARVVDAGFGAGTDQIAVTWDVPEADHAAGAGIAWGTIE